MVRLKGKSRGWLRAGLLLGLLLVGPSAAGAQEQDRVVLLEDAGHPPRLGLSQALRIQLVNLAEVEVRQVPEAPGVSGRVRAASQLAHDADALVVVWAEPTVELPDGSSEAVLYVVGHDQGRALVEVVRVQGGDSPDVDRSLALKVREVVGEVVRNRAQAAQSELTLEPAAVPATERAEPPGWGATLGAGLAVGPLSGLGQWGFRLHGGPAWVRGPLRVSGLLELSWFPEVQARNGASHLEIREVGPGLLAHAQLREGPIWLGVRGGVALSFVQAQARSAFGSGDAGVSVASVLTGFDVEVPLGAGLGVVAGVELHTRQRRQRFTVAGESLVDMGRVRPLAQLTLTWSAVELR